MKKVGKFTEEGIIRQSSIYVHPLQCLQHKKRQHLTENDKLENRCTLVTNVGSVIYLTTACITIRIFIPVSTNAENVADVVQTTMHSHDIGEVTQERNHLNVLFVANDSQNQVTLLGTAEFTVETSHTNVTCVTRRLVSLDIYTNTSESTQETNHTNVTCVTRHLVGLELCTVT